MPMYLLTSIWRDLSVLKGARSASPITTALYEADSDRFPKGGSAILIRSNRSIRRDEDIRCSKHRIFFRLEVWHAFCTTRTYLLDRSSTELNKVVIVDRWIHSTTMMMIERETSYDERRGRRQKNEIQTLYSYSETFYGGARVRARF